MLKLEDARQIEYTVLYLGIAQLHSKINLSVSLSPVNARREDLHCNRVLFSIYMPRRHNKISEITRPRLNLHTKTPHKGHITHCGGLHFRDVEGRLFNFQNKSNVESSCSNKTAIEKIF